MMKRLAWVLAIGMMSFGMAGCGTTSGGAGGEAAGGTAAGVQAAGKAAGQRAIYERLDLKCVDDIQQFIVKMDGTREVLMANGQLWSISKDGQARQIRALPDAAGNYVLIPSPEVLIHYKDGRVMLEHAESGTEFFRLQGNTDDRLVLYSHDFVEMALRDEGQRYNVWFAPTRFSGIKMSESVQDFMTRQSPDFNMGVPDSVGVVRSIALGGNSRVAVAVDNPADGKVGLLYFLDGHNAPGRLQALARTNTPVRQIAISPSGRFVAALDTEGNIHLTPTGDDKGIRMFSKLYQGILSIDFAGNDLVLLGQDYVTRVNSQTGDAVWKVPMKMDGQCRVYGERVYCVAKSKVVALSADKGEWLEVLGFSSDAYGQLRRDTEGHEALSGTLQPRCFGL
ncbi:MAG: hypothetical protein FWC40_09020 [Proteobacteria bacterium]|nr:hypothetical protein [Pseudomonadota bacterium]